MVEVHSMDNVLQLLENYRYGILFSVVLLDVLGAPVTAMPLLFLAGAFAAVGKMSLASVVLLATLAAALGDVLWYGLGRSRGQKVLGFFSRFSRNGPVHLQRSLPLLKKYSIAFLLLSKFIPGIATLAPPVAGVISMPLLKFVAVDIAGRLLWAASVSWLGFAGAKNYLLFSWLLP
jgi:membrane protein DedA with SNARE-associated domain